MGNAERYAKADRDILAAMEKPGRAYLAGLAFTATLTVIGGILQISRNESRAGLPWLSKIPVLGYLFRKDTNQTRNRELLIFITPKILKQEPVQAKAS